MGLGDGGGEVGEVAALVADGDDGGLAVGGGEVGVDVDGADEEVEGDGVAIADGGNGAADDGFGGAVDADGATGDAGDAGVGDEGYFAFEFGDGEGGAGDVDFGHAGGDGATAAHDDDVTGADAAFGGGFMDGFGVVEADGSAGEAGVVHGGDFEDDAVGGDVAEADLDVGVGFEGLFQGGDEDLVLGDGRGVGEVFGEGLTSDGEAVAIEEAAVVEVLQEHGGAADAVEVAHGAEAAGGEVAEDGGFAADGLDVAEGEVDAGFEGEGEDVEDAVGRAAHGDEGGGGVDEGAAGEDVSRADVAFEEEADGLADAEAFGAFGVVDGGAGGGIGEGEADGFHGDAPGVEGGGDAAAAGSGAGGADDLFGFLEGHGAVGGAGGDVVDIEDGGGFAFVAAGHDGTSVDDEAWVVGAGEGHGEAGAIFVTVMQADDGVVAMGGADEFGAVGDDVAGGEGGVSAFVALGDVVADGTDTEGEADEAGFGAALFDELGEFVGVDVAEVAVEEGGADADLGFVEVLGGESEAPVEGVDAALPAVGE